MLASVVLLVELPLWSLFICRQPTPTKRAIIVDGEPGAMQDDELVFDPYEASQLREILERRTDAFADSVLKGDVIPKVAALVAREHDDARKVVDTPYEAGRLAEKQGVEIPSITSTTPPASGGQPVRETAPRDAYVEYTLHPLALLTANNPDQEAFRTHRVSELTRSRLHTTDWPRSRRIGCGACERTVVSRRDRLKPHRRPGRRELS